MEFAYLVELSKIDMHIRYFILKMCLDIEHAMKAKLLHAVEGNPAEDGYQLTRKFITEYPKSLDRIYRMKASSYAAELIECYYPFFPVWVFVEVLTFGDLINLCAYHEKLYCTSIFENKMLNSVRDLRNASAHNNCLIHNLNKGEITPDTRIIQFANQAGNGLSSCSKKLKNRFLYDFSVLLYTYDQIGISPEMKKHRIGELKNMMEDRFLKNKAYFSSNSLITSSYEFIKKIVDKMAETC